MIKSMQIIKEVEINHKVYILVYTMLEHCENGKERRCAYGYKLEQYLKGENQHKEYVAGESVEDVFFDYQLAEDFFGLIVDGDVFPESLKDHIEDWCYYLSKNRDL